MAAALDHHGRMKTAARTLLRLAPASLLILVAACAGARPPAQASDPAVTASLWQQIQSENGRHRLR
jgi:outer membrane biogenesis lipoprotein LolB